MFADMTPFELTMLIVGFGGQALFSARFLVQWMASEKAKRSVIPIAFWYLSIFGGLTLFAYALYRQDPVFIAGQGMGVFIYSRNLFLIYQERKASLVEPDDPLAPRDDAAKHERHGQQALAGRAG